jgi:crotonobetainyl-CoA:carnitine CoA-transferase CaiB-like acyl-CoA transferase
MTSEASSSRPAGASGPPLAPADLPGIRPARRDGPGCFDDVRVVEIGDEKGEFCGKLLAGDGADVIKVEPPGGGRSRGIGPYYEDKPDPERSLFYWHYNLGKRGVTLDLEHAEGRRALAALVRAADVVLDTTPLGYFEGLGLGSARFRAERPDLVWAAITPFGQTGPWRDFRGSDLVHLALGGEMYLCGYDAVEWATYYDTPPIAPQMWHALHISNEHAWIGVGAALLFRQMTGMGQFLDVAVHDACAQCTEGSVPDYIYNRGTYYRRTGMHASAVPRQVRSSQTRAGDGSYINGGPGGSAVDHPRLLEVFRAAGLAEDLAGVELPGGQPGPGEQDAINYAMGKYIESHGADEAFHALQACGVACAPVRPPEANLTDPHCLTRQDFAWVEHPEPGRSFVYPRHPRISRETPWKCGPRAPLLGEHNSAVFGDLLGLSAAEIRAATSGE